METVDWLRAGNPSRGLPVLPAGIGCVSGRSCPRDGTGPELGVLIPFLFLFLMPQAPAAGDPAAKPWQYSFEDPAELSAWECQPGITTERSDRWASEGKSSLQINVPPGTPWFGVQREVKLDEFRRHEFLEFDLHAVTPVDYAGFKLHAEKFQELLANHDRLQPGETIHVRLRLADNDIVRFGETATLSLWMANKTATPQAILVDNIRLTGFGGPAAELDRLRARIQGSNLSDPATAALLADCRAKLAGEVTADEVAGLKERWRTILAGSLDKHAEGNFHVVGVSPLDKIRRTDSLADLPVDPAERGVRLEMARNEYETRQLVFLPKTREGEVPLEISVGDLQGAEQALIPAADIELRLVDEIDIAGTTQFPGDKLTGAWPDPLLPNTPFTLKEGRLQSVWLTVKTGAATPPGEYQGRLAVKESGGKEISLPVTVKVWNFVLPEKSSLKSLFGAWSHNWAAFYRYARLEFGAWLTPPNFNSIPKERQLDAIRFFARYRATLQGMNTWGLMFGQVVPPVLQPDGSMSLTRAPRPDLPAYDEVAVAAMQNDGTLSIAEIGGHTKLQDGEDAKDAAFIARATAYLQMVERHAKEKGWPDPYCYMWDEPHLKPKGWSAVRKEARLVKTVAPGIKTVVASGVFSPTPKEAPFYKDIDAFVLLWDRTPQRDVQFLRKIGKEMWWYAANVTDAPYPNWAVNHHNFAVRIIPLMSYKFQMDGMLQWAATLFADANAFPPDAPRWPKRPWSMKEWCYRPGEGHVVYPAPDESFWPSIRLSNWRDGMEDYEYLKLLEKALPGLPSEKQKHARAVLSLTQLVTAPYDYSRQPADFATLRRETAALLERN